MANGSLCLSRKKNESVIIGGGLITVTVAEIRGDKVRLLFSAPKEMPVHRAEVHEAIERKKKKQSLTNLEVQGTTNGS